MELLIAIDPERIACIFRLFCRVEEAREDRWRSSEAAGGTGFAGGVGATVGVGPSLGHLILHAHHHEKNNGEDGSGGHEFDEGERRYAK